MNKNFVACVLMVVILGFSYLYLFHAREPNIDVDVYKALTAVTAEEAAKVIGDKGDIVVIGWDTTRHKVAGAEAEIVSFESAVRKHPGLRIVATEKIERNLAKMMTAGMAVPEEEFWQAVKAHPNAGVFVLFVPFPGLPRQELKLISEGQVKFVVVSGYNPIYKKLLTDGVIQLAIVPQFEEKNNNSPPRTTRELFDRHYLVLDHDQAAALPE